MARTEPHEPDKLTRYAHGELAAEDRARLEQHVAECNSCREYLSFVRNFETGLRDARPAMRTPGEPCPDSSLLIALEADELGAKTAEHVRAHMLFCKDCMEEYYALRRLRSPSWTEVIVRAVGGTLECLSLAGSGVILQPSYAAVRGETEPLSDRIHIEDTVVDPETEATSTVRVKIGAEPKPPAASVLLEAHLPQAGWRVYLFDAEDRELASLPLAAEETAIGSNLAYGSYTLKISKGPRNLATFAIEIRTI